MSAASLRCFASHQERVQASISDVCHGQGIGLAKFGLSVILLPTKFPQVCEYSNHLSATLMTIFYLNLKSSSCLTTHTVAFSLASQHGVACSMTILLGITSTMQHRAVLCLQKSHKKTFLSGSQVKLEDFLKVPLSSYLYAVQCAESKTSSCHLTTKIACHNHQKFA